MFKNQACLQHVVHSWVWNRSSVAGWRPCVNNPRWWRGLLCLPPFVCICFFHTRSQKPMQLGSPNWTYKYSTMSPGSPFIMVSECQCQGDKSQKHCRHGPCTIMSAGFFVLRCVTVEYDSLSNSYNSIAVVECRKWIHAFTAVVATTCGTR